MRIYLSPPHMGGEEFGFVEEAFASNWLSTVGPNISAFESEMEARIGRSCVALSSGTAALQLGLRLAGVSAGDEVLCPSLTFVASCNPARYLGARLVFVDSERESWNLDPELLEEAIQDRMSAVGFPPKALIIVHLYGQTAKMVEIREVCERYGIEIVEDAAEALGATYKDAPAGALAPFGVFSFNGNKIITTTGGGMLLTEDPAAAMKARFWSTQARDPGVAYEHSELGYNFRLSNVLAGIGRGQLRVLDARVARRREIAFRYRDELEPLGMRLMPQAAHGVHTNWLSVFLVEGKEASARRDLLIEALGADDIEARPVWKPMHLQPLYADAPMYGGAVSEDLFARGICLPSGTQMSPEDQGRVISCVHQSVTR